MEEPDGDDLLKVLDSFNIELRNISANPNVINAWFDSDCPDTRKLLNWITTLSTKNYVSPLELMEFELLETKLSPTQCAVELQKLNDNYISIVNTNLQSDEISYITNEITLLETENEGLNQLLRHYERRLNHTSLELTRQSQKEINFYVACKKLQESCEELCDKLDKSDMKLRSLLKKYNENINSEPLILDDYFSEDVNKLNFSLIPIIEMHRATTEESDYWWLDTKETYRKKIFRSHQKYVGNKVEIEVLEKVLNYLYQFNISDLYESPSENYGVAGKDSSEQILRDALYEVSSNVANYHIQQIQAQDTQRDLEKFRKISKSVSDLITNITHRYSYYLLAIYLQLQEKKRIQFVSEIYRTAHSYVSEELTMCEARTEQMEQIIEEYNSYMQKPICERLTVISSVAKMLSCEDSTLTSVVAEFGNIKSQINTLELELFSVDMKSEDKKAAVLYNDIKVLKDFLTSGPTYEIILIPLELRRRWQMVKEHLQKESASIEKATRIFKEMKSMNGVNNLKLQLWTTFLAEPQKLDSLLKKAEADFNQRNMKLY